jgi:hypothetical protein
MTDKFQLGSTIRDKITGVQGITTGRCHYLYGCTQYNVIQKVGADGKLVDNYWFDEGRLELLPEPVVQASEVTTETSGGPNREAPGPQG